jgi:membrane-associated phospholipid phosphatase
VNRERHACQHAWVRGRSADALLSFAMVAGAVALAIAVVVHPGPLPGEQAFVRRWQLLAEPVPTLAEWVRLATSTQAALVIGAVPAFWAIRRHRRAGVIAVAVVAGTMLVVQPVTKEVIDRPRPTDAQVDVRAPYSSMSFPSGHSMSTTAAWGTAAIVAARRGRPSLTIALCAPIVLTAAASQVQGVHWLSDVLAGTLVGAAAAGAAASVLLRAENARRSSPPDSVIDQSPPPPFPPPC